MSPDETSNFEAAARFAAFGLQERAEERRESASGPGSSHAATQATRQLLRRSLRQRNIHSILDLGCGDWNWMRRLKLPDLGEGLEVRYEGWEASPELVAEFQQTHGRPGQIDFRLCDATTTGLPQVDRIIARDILFHMPLHLAQPLVERISRSCRFFLSTSFLGMAENSDIKSYLPIENWGFHRINLNAPPFGLTDHLLEAVCEPLCSHAGHRRYICLYDFDPEN